MFQSGPMKQRCDLSVKLMIFVVLTTFTVIFFEILRFSSICCLSGLRVASFKTLSGLDFLIKMIFPKSVFLRSYWNLKNCEIYTTFRCIFHIFCNFCFNIDNCWFKDVVVVTFRDIKGFVFCLNQLPWYIFQPCSWKYTFLHFSKRIASNMPLWSTLFSFYSSADIKMLTRSSFTQLRANKISGSWESL